MYRDLPVHVFYLRSSAKNYWTYNLLQFSYILLMLLNLTSLLAGTCLSGSQYSHALYKHYLTPIKTEDGLIKQNLKDIAKYRAFDSKIKN